MGLADDERCIDWDKKNLSQNSGDYQSSAKWLFFKGIIRYCVKRNLISVFPTLFFDHYGSWGRENTLDVYMSIAIQTPFTFTLTPIGAIWRFCGRKPDFTNSPCRPVSKNNYDIRTEKRKGVKFQQFEARLEFCLMSDVIIYSTNSCCNA